MTKQTLSLEEITKRVFEIRQEKKEKVDIPYKKEIKAYKKEHPKPEVPFFSFGERRRKAKEKLRKYEKGLKKIHKKYQNHHLIQEWAELQKQCPHNYGPWKEIDGPYEKRTCHVCRHKQYRENFSDLGGGCGIG